MCTILLQILQINLHYALVRASKLTEEGIEINPSPENSNRNYEIKKLVQASKYGKSVEMQCTSNAYFAIIFSAVMSIDIWKTFDLDYILNRGDKIFKEVGVYQPLAVDELPHDISIEDTHVSAEMLAHESNLFVEKDNLFKNYRHYDLLKKAMEPYLHVLVSVWQLYGHNIMFMYLILTVVLAMVFIIQMERQFY